LGPITRGMDIGSDDDDPEQPAASPISEGESTRAHEARAVMPTPKPGLGMQQKGVIGGAAIDQTKPKEVPAPEPAWVVEKED
jgi:hypothetical protein